MRHLAGNERDRVGGGGFVAAIGTVRSIRVALAGCEVHAASNPSCQSQRNPARLERSIAGHSLTFDLDDLDLEHTAR
jgi:hypothetical protein